MSLTARAVLKANRLLRDLPDATLDQLAGLAVRRSVKRGQRIFAEGDPGDSLMGLISGQVRISATTPAGQEVFLNLLESGDSFGEIAVLDGNPRTANAEAVTDAELFVVRRVDLLALIEREPRLATQLLALLCKRLRWTSDLIEEAAFLSLPARLARRLVKMAEEHGSPVAGGIELRISQAELAGFLSVSRQVVNQQLQAWQRNGWVAVGRGRVVVKDSRGLAGVAE